MMLAMKQTNYRQWHPWFAWFPVPTQDGFYVWGQTVFRKDECSEAAEWACGPIWQYRVNAPVNTTARP